MRVALALLLIAAPAWAQALPGLGARPLYLAAVQQEAMSQGVPPALADAVAMVETGYRPDAVGSSGEVGLMQIMPATARQLGFSGDVAELFQPQTNIHLAVAYLSRAWLMSGGNVCRALMKYRAGLGEEMMSPLSITYCARAMAWLDATGSDLTHATPAFAQPAPAGAPVPAADPYVIHIGPAPAPAANPMLAALTASQANSYGRRTIADRNALLSARVQSHLRRDPARGVDAAVQDAIRSDE